jgi:hypothetical protein
MAQSEPELMIDMAPGHVPLRSTRCVYCGRAIRRGLLCAPDLRDLLGSCFGKERCDEEMARYRDLRSGLDAYQCGACGWWHNGRDIGQARQEHLYAVADALRAVGGDVRLALLAYEWHPKFARREEWSRSRPPVRERRDLFGASLSNADPAGARALLALGDRLRAEGA